ISWKGRTLQRIPYRNDDYSGMFCQCALNGSDQRHLRLTAVPTSAPNRPFYKQKFAAFPNPARPRGGLIARPGDRFDFRQRLYPGIVVPCESITAVKKSVHIYG